MTTIYPVILSGGSGPRLWPLSREHYPKQLLALAGEQTMLQQTAMRLDGLPGVESPVLAGKPDGTPRKLLDIGRMSQLGWKAQTDLQKWVGLAYGNL